MQIPQGGIAFFDSGIGGLTVMNACKKYFHSEIFYYYGDNARAPYGNLSAEIIYKYTKEAFEEFSALNVKAAVIACNTVTALCIDRLRAEFSFPIIGTEPCVLTAAKGGGRVFVLTTRATFESRRFNELCARTRRAYPYAEILPFSCDGLAGEIERNFRYKNYDYSAYFPKGKPSSVVLGCTHYVYVKKQIEAFYGCPALDGNDGVARRLLSELENKSENIGPKGEIFKKTEFLQPQATTANICSGNFRENRPKLPQNTHFLKLFWLGSGKIPNKRANEQMFAIN
jgi:glutamate racemase